MQHLKSKSEPQENNLRVIYTILESKLFLLLAATFLASQFCPKWLSPLASISADRQWQLNLRERTLTALDEAVLYYLFALEDQCQKKTDPKDSAETRRKALIAMNKCMIQIRLLYGEDVMKKVEADLPVLIGNLYQEAKAANTDAGRLKEFNNKFECQKKVISERVNYWENYLAQQKMIITPTSK